MQVLWVFAHPEPRSLNGRLREEGLAALAEAGHDAESSDLYAMDWKPAVDASDFADPPGRLRVPAASERAHRCGRLHADIRAEQAKLDRADAVVFQFPLWWYGMPAILKGWFDRVFVQGYAYGIPDPDDPGRSLRYGRGPLAGKRALVVLTTGSPGAALGPRGINGQLDHVLFPLLHGTLWYVGLSVLPPVAITGADRLDADGYARAAARVRQRVRTIPDTPPLPFRTQSGGDYDENLVLRPHLVPGVTGLEAHYGPQRTLSAGCPDGTAASTHRGGGPTANCDDRPGPGSRRGPR